MTLLADPAISAAEPSSAPGNDKGKGKAEVPHKILYTVAGMPRPMKEGLSSVDGERRGPREGTVVALTTWKLRDLKVGLLQATEVCRPRTDHGVDHLYPMPVDMMCCAGSV